MSFFVSGMRLRCFPGMETYIPNPGRHSSWIFEIFNRNFEEKTNGVITTVCWNVVFNCRNLMIGAHQMSFFFAVLWWKFHTSWTAVIPFINFWTFALKFGNLYTLLILFTTLSKFTSQVIIAYPNGIMYHRAKYVMFFIFFLHFHSFKILSNFYWHIGNVCPKELPAVTKTLWHLLNMPAWLMYFKNRISIKSFPSTKFLDQWSAYSELTWHYVNL